MISVKPRLRLLGLLREWVPVCAEPERIPVGLLPSPVRHYRLGHLDSGKPVRWRLYTESTVPVRVVGSADPRRGSRAAVGGARGAVVPPPAGAPTIARPRNRGAARRHPTGTSLHGRLRQVLQSPISVFLAPNGPLSWPGPLYPFQIQGVEALIDRPCLLLADDMGLGKTVQVLAAIRILFHRQEVRHVLIVVPASLMHHWEREAAKWAPELTVQCVHGPGRETMWDRPAAINITSYHTCANDVEDAEHTGLVDRPWDLIVLDEASKIKSLDTKISRATKRLWAERRWALTGTPLENQLGDVYSIVQFLDPYLAHTIYLGGFSVESVHEVLGEIQLRRRKADVLTQLPPKIHHNVYVEPSNEQRNAMLWARMAGIAQLREKKSYVDIPSILALITRLKQICNHEPQSGSSPKLDDIEAKLEELVQQGHRALIFSQFICETFGVRFLAQRLARFNPLFFTGELSLEQRAETVRMFTKDDRHKVMILSTRAGGFGLNLQVASYVFHFDRWWNPAVESQAEDRAHRIGQTQAVTVYRYILSGTIEERIEQILREKEHLFATVVDRTSIPEDKLFSRSDYLRMLGLDEHFNPIAG